MGNAVKCMRWRYMYELTESQVEVHICISYDNSARDACCWFLGTRPEGRRPEGSSAYKLQHPE